MHDVLLFGQVLVLVYWLGADLGVFYASRFVADPQVAPAGRAVAARIMHAVDLSPRVCLILALPTGVALMALDGPGSDVFGGWPLALAVVGSSCWLALMLSAFLGRPGRRTDLIRAADATVRVLLVVGLTAVATYAFVSDEPFGVDTQASWLAGKVLAYAVCIAGGLGIRAVMRPLGPALGAVVAGRGTPRDDQVVADTIRAALPWVYVVWGAALVGGFLSVANPGAV